MQEKSIPDVKFELPVKTEAGTAGGQPVRDKPAPGEVNSLSQEAAKHSLIHITLLGKMPQKTQRQNLES